VQATAKKKKRDYEGTQKTPGAFPPIEIIPRI